MLRSTNTKAVKLSRRQQEVLRMLAEGTTNPEIAFALGISLDGAKWHVGTVLEKLNVSKREDAADYWLQSDGASRGSHPAWVRWLGLGSAAGVASVSVAVSGLVILNELRNTSRTDTSVAPEPVPAAAPVYVSELDTALALTVSCLAARGIPAHVIPGSGMGLPRLGLEDTVTDPPVIGVDVRACRDEFLAAAEERAINLLRPDQDIQREARSFVATCIQGRGGAVTTLTPGDADISQWMDSADPITRIAAGRCIEERNRVYGF